MPRKGLPCCFLLLVLVAAGCGGTSSDGGVLNPPPQGGTLSAYIDGASFKPTSATFTALSATSIQIDSWNTSNVNDVRSLMFEVPLPASPSTVTIAYGEVHLPDPGNPGYRATWYAHVGGCTFTSITPTRVKGTFGFTATNSSYGDVQVTSGMFDVCLNPQCL